MGICGKIFQLLLKVNLFRSAYSNFKYLPFYQAIQFSFFVYYRTVLHTMGEKIIINILYKPGMIRIGSHSLGMQDVIFSRTIGQVSSKKALIGVIRFCPAF